MKRIFLFGIFIAYLFVACEPNEELYDQLDEEMEPYNDAIEYTLTPDDYATIADLAVSQNPGDTLNARFIESNEYFTDSITAADYVPLVLGENFPALGAGSSAQVTFNYNGAMPEDYSKYTQAQTFELTPDHYAAASSLAGMSHYFFPEAPADVYLPLILDSAKADAENGEVFLVSYKQSDVTPEIDTSEQSWTETFDNGLGAFSGYNISGDLTWYQDSYSGTTYAKMSGFDTDEYVSKPNEDWLISEGIDLSEIDNPVLAFEHALNYIDEENFDMLSVHISTDFDESDVEAANWSELDVPNWPSGSDYTYVNSGDISLSDYADQTVFIAFKYTSSSADGETGTWQIKEVKIAPAESGPSVVGKAPKSYSTFYTKEGGEWVKDDYAYSLNPEDYDAMGAPGEYDNFSEDAAPQDYLPKLVNQLYPLAGEGTSKLLVYDYYTGDAGVTLASKYTFTGGKWVSDYQYVQEKTQQFLYSGEVDRWVFDPSVSFEMTEADYQIIVDYVKNEVGSEYLDSYGNTDYYYGASAYFANFDGRNDDDPETGFDNTVFNSWQEAVKEALGEALLPMKFPDAQAQVNGVDVFYTVYFDVYTGEATLTFMMKYQCTESAPDPVFELAEGPLQQ